MTTSKNKIRVAVLFGGRSAEHEVSLKSAMNVIQYLDPSLFEVVPIGINKEGHWLLDEKILEKSITHQHVPQLNDDHQAWFSAEWVGKEVAKQTPSANLPCMPDRRYIDVVFPAVHGTLCEDGTLQGLLEQADVPYVGCGVLSSAIGMDKDVSKRLAQHAGIASAPYMVIKHEAWLRRAAQYATEIAQKILYPVFIKPANTGSSIGITKVKTPDQLPHAIEFAFQFDKKVLVEKALNVMELEVSVLESLQPNEDPIVSVVGEIKPSHEFYSYEAKYLDENGAALIIPAPLSDEIAEEARLIAKRLFNLFECEGMARVDLFLDKDSNRIVFNEINTLPGFTQISMYPKLMQASGMSYTALLTHLVQLAIKRHQAKSHLLRSYVGVE